MKKLFIHLFAALAIVSTLSACSDDDKELPGQNLKATTYVADNLSVSIDGQEMGFQQVVFTPGVDGKATIKLSTMQIALDELTGALGDRADMGTMASIPAAGIIPGSPEVTINADLSGSADKCVFSGNGEADYCTFAYDGAVEESGLVLNIKDVKLKNTSLAGKYNMRPLDDKYFNVARIEWDSEAKVMGFLPMKSVIGMTLVMPLLQINGIPAEETEGKISVLQALSMVLESVTFGEDGSITAVYLDTKTGQKATAPKGLAQYVVASDGMIKVYLNPRAIIAAAAKGRSSRALDLTTILSKIDVESLLTQVIPMFSQGVPVHYGSAIVPKSETSDEMVPSDDPNFVSFYLGTETLLPLLKTIAPIFKDDEIVNAIVEAASKDPDMASMAQMLPAILKALPEVIEKTSKVEIGLNLQKQ